MFCFFKQKTAYEVRISDWSSDVCSSDLLEKDEEVEQVARQKCAVQPQQLKLEERVEMPAAPVEPGQDCVAKHCKRQQRREQQHHRGQPVQPQYELGRAVGSGKRVSVRVDLGGRRHIKKKKKEATNTTL